MTDTFSHYQIRNGDVRLSGAQTGAGEPIIFLHGFPEYWGVWRRPMTALSRIYQCTAFDMRGFNLSDKPKDPALYRLTHTTTDVSAVADALNIDSFSLVGHDWGGIVAWRYAQLHPDRVRKLIILNAPHPQIYQDLLWSDAKQRQAAQYARRLALVASAEAFAPEGPDSIWRRLYTDHVIKGELDDRDRHAFFAAWGQNGAIDGMLNWYRAGEFYVPSLEEPYRPDATPAVTATLHMPVLVLWGEQDPLLNTALLERLDDFVADLTIRRFSNAGHGLVHEKPTEVVEAIRAFLKA